MWLSGDITFRISFYHINITLSLEHREIQERVNVSFSDSLKSDCMAHTESKKKMKNSHKAKNKERNSRDKKKTFFNICLQINERKDLRTHFCAREKRNFFFFFILSHWDLIVKYFFGVGFSQKKIIFIRSAAEKKRSRNRGENFKDK